MVFCHTCDKAFQTLGIARHRAMHRDKREDCDISYKHVRCLHEYSKWDQIVADHNKKFKGDRDEEIEVQE